MYFVMVWFMFTPLIMLAACQASWSCRSDLRNEIGANWLLVGLSLGMAWPVSLPVVLYSNRRAR